MTRFFPMKMTALCALAGLALAGVLSASSARADGTAFGVPLSPNAHLYSYFIINGMARGAFLLGQLHQKDMPTLIQMDEVTRKAVIHNLDSQTIRSDFRAEQILTRYLGLILK
ncbi:hypothetical protein DTQ13_09030 [Parasaccharibacter sp. TMW 2.1888]|uniref:hypothetical protein n=1 Tax=Parasaccharibacter sp. TMW 2.1888 TaxID=2268025 RepID=UPI002056F82D|nr:hypothetical protein [Parasaccharibacter sp. TMW 2.1888]UPO80392.1 hypothetical protein DTQ13_09030 [Parasaccharibacter sp. TMW 2.1888]